MVFVGGGFAVAHKNLSLRTLRTGDESGNASPTNLIQSLKTKFVCQKGQMVIKC